MKIEVFVLVLFLIPIAYAQEEYQNYETINVNTIITSELTLDSGVNYLSSELSFFPRNTDFQSIINKEYTDKVYERQDYILYEWNNLPEKLTFGLDYGIKSNFNIAPIRNKIPFPIKVPDE